MNYKKITIHSYDSNPEFYSNYFKRLFDLYRRKEFGDFIDLVPQRGRVLDVGCGSGDHSLYFKEKGLEVVGIDLSRKMVEISRGKGVDARVMDMENLEFESESFDGVWAVASLLHVPKRNIPGVVENISKILKPEGILYVGVKRGEGERFVPDKCEGNGQRFFSYWSEDEMLNFFENYLVLNFRARRVKNTTFLEGTFRKST